MFREYLRRVDSLDDRDVSTGQNTMKKKDEDEHGGLVDYSPLKCVLKHLDLV